MKPVALTQRMTVRARFLRRVTRAYFGSDEIRWRMLITTSRFTSHFAIIVVALFAIVLAGLRLGSAQPVATGEKPSPVDSNAIQADPRVASGSGRNYSPASLQSYLSLINQDGGLVARRAVADTRSPSEARTGIITYTVQSGDTIETIAARFRLLPTTLVWSNKDVEDAPDRLSIGQILYVLPSDGIWYEVQTDDTLQGIADKFKAKVEDIESSPLNNLAPGANLLAGVKIVVPNGVKPFVARQVETSAGGGYSGPVVNAAGSGQFIWPTRGVISQGFYGYHPGIDIANAIGIPVGAADGGYVSFAGWDNTGYGYMVMINHGNGFTTLYGHLSQYYVDPGQPVVRGQLIAAMGSTGHSTGPHLHFEIRYGGAPQNPFFYLP